MVRSSGGEGIAGRGADADPGRELKVFRRIRFPRLAFLFRHPVAR